MGSSVCFLFKLCWRAASSSAMASVLVYLVKPSGGEKMAAPGDSRRIFEKLRVSWIALVIELILIGNPLRSVARDNSNELMPPSAFCTVATAGSQVWPANFCGAAEPAANTKFVICVLEEIGA